MADSKTATRRWTPEAHEDLLTAVLVALDQHTPPVPHNQLKEAVERVMTSRGHTFSWDAIR